MTNPACCSCCVCTGWGKNFFCCGIIYCAPDYVKEYSRFKNDGGDANVIVINTAQPMQNYWFNQQHLFVIFLLNKYRDFFYNFLSICIFVFIYFCYFFS